MNDVAALYLLRDFDALLDVVSDMNRTQFTPTAVLDKLDQLITRLETLLEMRDALIGASFITSEQFKKIDEFIHADEKKNPKVTGIFDHKYAKSAPALSYGQGASAGSKCSASYARKASY